MNKTALLTTASMIFLSAAAQARVDIQNEADFGAIGGPQKQAVYTMEQLKQTPLSEQPLLTRTDCPKLEPSLVVKFAQFAYAVNQLDGWDISAKKTYNELINGGWKLAPFNGATGTAYNPVESVLGVLGFKGDQVVIATRGTTNWNDLMTDLDAFPSPAAPYFGIDGKIANGFLQAHLSSWDSVRKAIIEYAASLGKEPKDLSLTFTGHSMGGGITQLMFFRSLTDPELGIGVRSLERSFIDDDVTKDLGMSGFYGIGKKTKPHNPGNVEAIVFESPRAFDQVAAQEVNAITGKGKLLRVENEGRLLGDPVIYLPPEFLGYAHAGTSIIINEGPVWNRHFMEVAGAAVIPVMTAVHG